MQQVFLYQPLGVHWRTLALACYRAMYFHHETMEAIVFCARCRSCNRRTLDSEMAIHFPGLSGINIPHIFVNPEVVVCLDCGFGEFVIPDAQIRKLRLGRMHGNQATD